MSNNKIRQLQHQLRQQQNQLQQQQQQLQQQQQQLQQQKQQWELTKIWAVRKRRSTHQFLIECEHFDDTHK